MNNSVIYARCDNDTQTEHIIEAQLQECREYAKREGLTVIETYIDRGSANTDERAEFRRMIADSKKRMFQTVLVSQFDRFARNRFDSAHYKNLLKKNGVRVISAQHISEDASGILMESVLESMAEYYSAELSKKIKQGIALKKERKANARGDEYYVR